MDLFHTITQEIENVLSCHWLTEFRESSRSSSNSRSNSSSAASRASGSRSTSAAPTPLRRSISSSSVGSLSSSAPASPILRAVRESKSKSKMSDQLMDTEPGGESTQYESIQTVTKPPAKESGQMGDPATGTDETAQDGNTGVDAGRAEKTADNIRYGQNISESGVGGFTNTSKGTANQEGGYGGTKSQEELEGNQTGNADGRTEQGYSAKDGTHDYKVGG